MKFLLMIVFVIGMFGSTGECRDFIFMLNDTPSMNRSDPSNAAHESVLWGMQNMSEEDKAEFVTFNDDVNMALHRVFDTIPSGSDVERNIILITDNANLANANTIKRAQFLHVPIHVLNLDENRDVMTTMRTLMQKNFRPSSFNMLTNKFNRGVMPVDLPDIEADRLKVMLISSSPGDATLLNAEHRTVVDGRFVKVYELERTDVKHFDLKVDYPLGTGLTVDVIADLNGQAVEAIGYAPWLIGSAAIAFLILLSIPLIKKRSTKVATDVSYRGKLLISLTKSSGEYDPAPREFNLFRSPAVELNLRDILSKCNILSKFDDAESILIIPDSRGITLKNNSSCTMTKSNVPIERGGRVELWYNDAVNISTEDDTSELILTYKSLKSNGAWD